MKRILVIGSPGAGKSTLALELGRLLNLPLIHLDKEFWNPGWIETPRDKWDESVSRFVERDSWIIDGTFDRTLDIRLKRADTVIFLDFPRYLCLYRIFKRVIGSYDKVRFDMAEGCPEKFDREFIKWVWNYRRDHYPKIFEALEKYFPNGNLIHIKYSAEVKRFLERVKARDNFNRSGSE